ncbi:uncharacterized protein LAJ45_10115 [Morchella importuna]|uniref:uncharacterized protein n=1 Tax=Morchella importuna TaxID=1174673 RepID=UPI001E8DD70A|nr:uncharacterized protein LAJ45_10115 [Morchella importuna]KAH8145792.1 hypothetical protein LAJ45_10115 [Morchella importuna]
MSFQPHLNPYYGRIPPADTTYPPQLPFMPTLDPSTAQLTLHTPFTPHTLITLTPSRHTHPLSHHPPPRRHPIRTLPARATPPPPHLSSVLVLEMVLPGTTISDVMAEVIALPIAVGDTVEDRQMRWQRARARLRLMGLHGSAVRAVDRVGACGAGHNGVGGGKMVVGGTGRGGEEEVVVLVGWGSAMVVGVRGGWRGDGWSGLHAAFLEGGGVGEGWG